MIVPVLCAGSVCLPHPWELPPSFARRELMRLIVLTCWSPRGGKLMLLETDVDLEYDDTLGHLGVLTKEGPC